MYFATNNPLGANIHVTIEIVVPASHTNELIDDLEQLDEVIRLTAIREGLIKPPGGVLMVHTLNRGADKVMRLADTIREHGQVSISTHELTSIVDP